MLQRIPWYPPVLAGTYILNFWIVSGVSLFAMTRALAVTVVAVALTLGIVIVLTRRPHPAAAVVAILFAMAAGRGATGLAAALLFAAALTAGLVVWGHVQAQRPRWAHVTAAMNVVSLILLMLVLVGGAQRGTFAALVDTDLRQGASAIESAANDAEVDRRPDVYVLLLDGYPRSDVLLEDFGLDNGAFLDELERRGFEIAADSESNYPHTAGTLTSMLHMRPLHEVDRLEGHASGEGLAYPLLRQVANENPVFDAMRAHGYRVVASSPGYEQVTLRQADVFLDDASANEAERQLLRGTPVQLIIDTVAPQAILDQYRQRVLAGFDAMEELIRVETGGIFAFIHVPSPHQPVVLDREGSLVDEVPREAMFRTDPIDPAARDAYVDQLGYLNERTLRAVDRLLARDSGPDREPVIIVLSDHGAAPTPDDGVTWTPSHYRNFLAVHAGAAVDFDLPADSTPVNLFPRLFLALFGEEHPTWPDDQFPWTDAPVPATMSGP